MANRFLIPRPRKLLNMVSAGVQATQLTDELRSVVDLYPFGLPRKMKRPASGASRSKNFILEFQDGRRVLKRYKSTMTPEAIAYEHSVLNHLVKKRFPAPRLLVDSNGQTLVELDGRAFAMFDFITGFCYTDFWFRPVKNSYFLDQAGLTLARLHRDMEGVKPAGRKVDGFTPNGSRRWQDCAWFCERFKDYHLLLDDYAENLVSNSELLRELESIQSYVQDAFSRLAECDDRLIKVVIHGDYGPHNLLFDSSGVAGVLDFECAHFDYRVTDLVAALLFFYRRRTRWDAARAHRFLDAYHSIWPLSALDAKAAPDALQVLIARRLLNRLREYVNSHSPKALDRAQQTVRQLKWCRQIGNELVDAFPAKRATRSGG